LARDHDAHRKRFAGWPSVEQIAAVIDPAAFDMQREDRAVWGVMARDASKRCRIALAKAQKDQRDV